MRTAGIQEAPLPFLRGVVQAEGVVAQGRGAPDGDLLAVEAHVGQRIPVFIECVVFKSAEGEHPSQTRAQKGAEGEECLPHSSEKSL